MRKNKLAIPSKVLEQQGQFSVFAIHLRHLGLRTKFEYKTVDQNFSFNFSIFTFHLGNNMLIDGDVWGCIIATKMYVFALLLQEIVAGIFYGLKEHEEAVRLILSNSELEESDSEEE